MLPQDGLAAAVVAFSAHFYTAPHGARFLVALADRIGSDIGALDVVLAQPADPTGDSGLALEEIEARDHPRVVRALRYREDVRVWRTPDHAGHVLIGRGLAGRWEMAFEVAPSARGGGLGRRLARAATALVPSGEVVWAQVSPGHPASLRAVLAAGYQPLCAEVLLPPRR